MKPFFIRKIASVLVPVMLLTLGVPQALLASNHREAPITALDHKADITDVYAFVSYSADQAPDTPPEKVTLIMAVDPLLEPANGPTVFPFDPDILYEIKIDNNHDALPDIVYQFRFSTEYQLPEVFTALAGFGDSGATDPETGNLVVPPQIRDFDNPGLNQRQTYTVTRRDLERSGKRGRVRSERTRISSSDGSPLYALPVNAGPRTMDYEALFGAATYRNLNVEGMSVFAGTVDDPFFIDLGAAFDTANFRTLGSGVPGVLTADEDAASQNFASDTVSGYAVNVIAIEVPIEMLTSTGRIEPATAPEATIGIWGTTSRPRITVRRSPNPAETTGAYRQVQRFGNPLINELIIGIGYKDRFSMDEPGNDAQFATFFLNPPIAQIVEALYNELLPGALDVPEADRTDLLPLVQYTAPIAAPGTPAGPIADLMRLNTGVPATPLDQASRLGLIAGDPAGFPNGRRLYDDVVDITLRVGVGGVLNPDFNKAPNNSLGDGVNVNDAPFRTEFPYLANSPDGRNRRHIDPGEASPDGSDIPVD
ncbi:MAG: DUF4331 domain-containing protein [Desulfobacteraceae bacterium]|nr:MAG: DUF4331 domain-containing protein [Desulfobacteraceae bacterium]